MIAVSKARLLCANEKERGGKVGGGGAVAEVNCVWRRKEGKQSILKGKSKSRIKTGLSLAKPQ